MIACGVPGWTTISALPGKTARGPRLRTGTPNPTPSLLSSCPPSSSSSPFCSPLVGYGVTAPGSSSPSAAGDAGDREREAVAQLEQRPHGSASLAAPGAPLGGRPPPVSTPGRPGSLAAARSRRRHTTTIHQPATCQATMRTI